MARRKGGKQLEEKGRRLQRMQIVHVDVDDLKPNAYNPNRQDSRTFAMLLHSMLDDGFTVPILVHQQTGEIVDGEHRWRAARQLATEGIPSENIAPQPQLRSVPVVYVDFTEFQRRLSTLRHNRATGSEDTELAIQMLRDFRELGSLDWAQEALGISDRELNRMLDDKSVAELLAAPEYSGAWEPTKTTAREEDIADNRRAITAEAQATQDEINKEIQQAAPEARPALEGKLRRSLVRVSVIFRDDDAEIVRGVLEPKPAEQLLALCLAELARREPQDVT